MKKSFSVMVAIVLIASMSLLAFAACVTDDETDDHPNMEYVSAVDATCVEDGNIEYWYCPDCGKYFSDEMGEQEITLDDTVIAATGEHDWGEWVTDSESSCTVGGTRHRICVDCGERQDGTLPVGDHDLNFVNAVDATCTNGGNIAYWHCSECGNNYSDEEATEVLNDVTTPKAAHDMTYVAAQAHTCTNDGNIEYWHCSACGYNFADEDGEQELESVVDPAAHTWGEWEQTSDPTCTERGVLTRVCEVCFDEEYDYIDELGHDFEGAEWAYNDANHWNLCNRCGAESERADHEFNNGVCFCGALAPTETSEFCFVPLDNGTMKLAYYRGDDASVVIPTVYQGKSVTEISENAFIDKRELQTIVIPSSINVIGEYAFAGCSALIDVTIEKGVETIESCAFESCCSLTNIDIPDSVTSIGSRAFYNCSGLTSITIPDSVTSIGSYAFAYCSGLTSITIPDSVTSVGEDAFYACDGLTSITIPFAGEKADGTGETHFGYIFGASSYSYNDDYVPESLKEVIITGGTSIGHRAFYNCSGLTSIVIPDSVTSIGEWQFYGCSGLASITIPDSVTSIGEYAFYNCSGLTSITIPDSVTSIGGSAFSGCSGLTSIVVADGNPVYHSDGNCLIETGSKTLIAGCKTSVIPDDGGVTSIGSYAFSRCSGLTSIVIPDSVTSIGSHAFEYCSSLTSITIPDSVTSIGRSAFYECSGLTSVTIPDSVTSIGDYAFSECSGLTSITIPDSVTSIGSYAFRNCSGLTSITISFVGQKADGTRETHFGYIFGASSYSYNDDYVPSSLKEVIITGGTSIGSYAFYNCSSLTSITIPDSVTSIGSYAFCGCSGLTSITIPDSVTSIGDGAFYSCDGLTSITIPDSVTSIGDSVFAYCDGLTSITIPDSVTSIGEDAFYGCSGLTSVIIPDSVTYIGSSAFSGCNKLESITIPFVGKSIKTAEDTYQYPFGYIFGTSPYSGGSATKQYYYGASTTSTMSTTYYIPSTLKSVTVTGGNILRGAFYDCDGLTSVTIGDSVTRISEYAFYGCSGLTSITIPFVGGRADGTGVTHFGYIFGASEYNQNYNYVPESLKEVIITGGTSIGWGAFYNCSGLASITIPDSVTSIDDYAFYGCSGLTSIVVEEGNPVYYSSGNCIIETESKTLIAGCKSSVIPDDGSVTSIGINAFSYCSGLTSITIPDSVTSISGGAFEGCSGLTSVTIPDSVTSIGEDAFYGCSSLQFNEYGGAKYLGNDANPYLVLYDVTDTSVTSFEIMAQTKILYDDAFRGCSGLTSITIPDSVTSIGEDAFRGCSGLTSVTIPDSVTSIGDFAFFGCSGLTSVTIPDSVTSIGHRAFCNCSGLTSIVIPDSVTSIGEYVFYGCSSLTSVTIPDGVTSIGDYAFEWCDGLTSIVIPDSVTSIGDEAFRFCSNLTTINFQGTMAQWQAIKKGSSWNANTRTFTVICTDGTISKADA